MTVSNDVDNVEVTFYYVFSAFYVVSLYIFHDI